MEFYYRARYPDRGVHEKFEYVGLDKVAAILRGKYDAQADVKNGTMEIKIPGKKGRGTTMPRELRSDLLGYGLNITRVIRLRSLTAKQLFAKEAAAREKGKTILPIGTVPYGVEFCYNPAPEGNPAPAEHDDF